MTANRVQLELLVSPVGVMSPHVFGLGHWFLNAHPGSSSRDDGAIWVQGTMRKIELLFLKVKSTLLKGVFFIVKFQLSCFTIIISLYLYFYLNEIKIQH